MPTFRKTVLGYFAGFILLALTGVSIFAAAAGPGAAAALRLSGTLLYWAAVVYFFMAVHRIHKILRAATNGKYPISPARAVGFSFIPFYNLYWMFKWPGETALFLNHVTHEERLKKDRWGWLLLLASLISGLLPGLSLRPIMKSSPAGR